MVYNNMEHARYIEVIKAGAALTEAEVKEGWHFCPEWDFLLIHPDDPEAECCDCQLTEK
jgi:hypothetical protein